MNLDNFKLVLDHIKSNPTCWVQTYWHCGTSHCFAGWAQILSGKAEDEDTARRDARVFLDLPASEADYLFSGARKIADFEAALANPTGYNPTGYNRDGYNPTGYNRYGYDYDGLDKGNKPRA